MTNQLSRALIAGGLPSNDLPTSGERPALVLQAQALACEQRALVIAWPRWDMAVITPAAPPLGLVAGGLGLLLPPDELVVAPEQAAVIATMIAALLAHPTIDLASAAITILAPIATPEAALWRVVIAGWGAALSRGWEQLDQAILQTYKLLDRPVLPQAARAGALLALAVLELEAGEPAGQAEVWLHQALSIFTQLGLDAPSGLVRWVLSQALQRQGRHGEAYIQAEAALAPIDPASAPAAAALIQAGVAGLRMGQAQSAEQRTVVVAQLADAARRCPVETTPLLAARLLVSLGDTHQSVEGDVPALREALACYQRASQLFGDAGTAEDLAAVKMSEGSVWQGLDGDVRGHTLKAIDCYHQALRVFTLAAHPAEYALIHNNLATAYLKMPISGERDIMRQALAVQSMQEALKVYTLEESPREYAMVQNNLGNVLQYMPSGDRVDKLDRAIEAYHEALRVRTRQRSPIEFAVTISNLANAYVNVPAEERRQMLGLAATKEALDLDVPHMIGVQHHHAHIASVLAEHGLAGSVISVAADGTGYGSDGAIWGCEIMIADLCGFERLAHLAYAPLLGGERAVREPWCMAAVYLAQAYGDAFLDLDIPFVRGVRLIAPPLRNRWRPLAQMIARGINSPPASSLGRLFDAVAALLGLRDEVVYEGQAAIELELLAEPSDAVYPFEIRPRDLPAPRLSQRERGPGGESQPAHLDVAPLIRAIVEDIQRGVSLPQIAGRFHRTIAELLAAACMRARAQSGLEVVALSGGVFQNQLLLEQLIARLEDLNFQVYINRRVPPNDGGLSLGQAAIAAARLQIADCRLQIISDNLQSEI